MACLEMHRLHCLNTKDWAGQTGCCGDSQALTGDSKVACSVGCLLQPKQLWHKSVCMFAHVHMNVCMYVCVCVYEVLMCIESNVSGYLTLE